MTSNDIFEGNKPEKIWLMRKHVFEVFAMHDVGALKKNILAWVSNVMQFFNPSKEMP